MSLPPVTPFGKFLERHGITPTAAAEALGIQRQHVWHLTVGKFTPSLKLAARIRRWTVEIDPLDPIAEETWDPWLMAEGH